MNKAFWIAPVLLAVLSAPLAAQEKFPPSKVDYPGFASLTEEIMEYRQTRLVQWDAFRKLAADEDAIILDVRSEAAYKAKHLKGAVHLNFSDFTEEKLAKVIPSKETRVLIYCNNNIAGDQRNFATKAVRLALNIPTFVNLYGYGYENIYELKDLIPADHETIVFEGTAVPAKVAKK